MKVVYRELVTASVAAENAEEAIRKVGKLFLENGFVKDTYIDAVAARELEFPTGLQLADIGVAMPHTDSSHVNKPGICIAKMDRPVTFSHMGEPEKQVQAEILFMMSIQNPDEQIDNLQKVLKVFTNPEAVQEFKGAADDDALYEVARKYLD